MAPSAVFKNHLPSRTAGHGLIYDGCIFQLKTRRLHLAHFGFPKGASILFLQLHCMGSAIGFMRRVDIESETQRNTQANQALFRDRKFRDIDLEDEHQFSCLVSSDKREMPDIHRRWSAVTFDDKMRDRQHRNHSLSMQGGQRPRNRPRDCSVIWSESQICAESRSQNTTIRRIDMLKPLPLKIWLPLKSIENIGRGSKDAACLCSNGSK
jgi:hypothetical protein